MSKIEHLFSPLILHENQAYLISQIGKNKGKYLFFLILNKNKLHFSPTYLYLWEDGRLFKLLI